MSSNNNSDATQTQPQEISQSSDSTLPKNSPGVAAAAVEAQPAANQLQQNEKTGVVNIANDVPGLSQPTFPRFTFTDSSAWGGCGGAAGSDVTAGGTTTAAAGGAAGSDASVGGATTAASGAAGSDWSSGGTTAGATGGAAGSDTTAGAPAGPGCGTPGELSPYGPNAPTTPDLTDQQLQVLNDISQASQNPANTQTDLSNAASLLQSMGFQTGNPLANTGDLTAAQANNDINQLGLNSVDQNAPNGPVSFLSYMGRLVSHDEQLNGGAGQGASGDIMEQIAADATGQTVNGQSATFAPDATQANWLMAATAWSLSQNSNGQMQLDGNALNDMGLGLTYASAAGGSNIMTDLNSMSPADTTATINSQTADTFAPNPNTPQGMQQLEQTSGWNAQQIATDAVVGHLLINPGQLTDSSAGTFFSNAANMNVDPVDAGLLDNLPGGAQWASSIADSSSPAAAGLNSFLAVNAQALGDPSLMADAVANGNPGTGGGSGYSGGEWGGLGSGTTSGNGGGMGCGVWNTSGTNANGGVGCGVINIVTNNGGTAAGGMGCGAWNTTPTAGTTANGGMGCGVWNTTPTGGTTAGTTGGDGGIINIVTNNGGTAGGLGCGVWNTNPTTAGTAGAENGIDINITNNGINIDWGGGVAGSGTGATGTDWGTGTTGAANNGPDINIDFGQNGININISDAGFAGYGSGYGGAGTGGMGCGIININPTTGSATGGDTGGIIPATGSGGMGCGIININPTTGSATGGDTGAGTAGVGTAGVGCGLNMASVIQAGPGASAADVAHAVQVEDALPTEIKQALLDGGAKIEVAPGFQPGDSQGTNDGICGMVYTDSGEENQALIHESSEMAGQILGNQSQGLWGDPEVTQLADQAMTAMGPAVQNQIGDLNDTIGCGTGVGCGTGQAIPGNGDLVSNDIAYLVQQNNPTATAGDTTGQNIETLSAQNSPQLVAYLAQELGLVDPMETTA